MSGERTSLEFGGGRRAVLVVGDLLEEPVDAIVNAANGLLVHGGGVAAAIAGAAGTALEAEGRAYVSRHGPIPVGQAVATTAGALPFLGVIHAVGPRQGEGNEERSLAQAVVSALTCAQERGWRSVSLPAISSGIFAVPLQTCARAYVAGIVRFFSEHADTGVREVRICLRPGPLVELVAREMQKADSGLTR